MKQFTVTVFLLVTVTLLSGCEGDRGGLIPTGPRPPQNVSATQGPGVQNIVVSWTTVSDATSYNLYWSNSSGVSRRTGTLVSNVTSSYTHTHLNAGIYYYVVTAQNADGESVESAEVTAPVNLVSFVTSTKGTPDLSTWPDAISAGSLTGIAAGDAICQARANAANLTGTYKAWLSTSSTDAFCHVQNLTGKRSTNCGQSTLPVAAGPWVRTDGAPFASTIDQMTLGTAFFYTPLIYDESGTLYPGIHEFVQTATSREGTKLDGCSDWSDATSSAFLTGFFTDYTAGFIEYTCSYQASPLMCMQIGSGPPLSITPAAGKKVFFTSTTYDGNLGGLPGADTKCQTRASAAGLANAANFKAWLSDSSTSAISRLTSSGPWVRIDGFKVANDKADLSDGNIITSISQDEFGNYSGNNLAWTGSGTGAAVSSYTCNDWTDNSALVNGFVGWVTATAYDWTLTGSPDCSWYVSLYCFED